MYNDVSRKATNKYHKTHMTSIAFRLMNDTEREYIEIYKSIPNKREWLKQALLDYKNSQK